MTFWFAPFTDLVKKKVCRYLLHRYLGSFIHEKISLDQLNVDFYNGKGTISDIVLDPEVCIYILKHDQTSWHTRFLLFCLLFSYSSDSMLLLFVWFFFFFCKFSYHPTNIVCIRSKVQWIVFVCVCVYAGLCVCVFCYEFCFLF